MISEYFENNKFTFLVTGGAGFIGSNVCAALLEYGNQVICLDNFSLGRHENIKDFKADGRFRLIKGDVRDYATCLSACNGVDFVLHQAAWGSVPRSIDKPQLYNDINIKGTLNIFEASYRQGVKKCVYASSSSVYGDYEGLPQVESNVGNVLSPYALTKKVCEEYGRLYKNLYGLDTYGLRYFNIFGKKQNVNGDYAAVIPIFIKSIEQGFSPTIHGDGTQTRDFTYVDNAIQANIRACFANSAYAGDAYNIATGISKNLIDIYETICSYFKKDIVPIFSENRKGDIKHSVADISRAKKCLGYIPEVDFKTGLLRTLSWYVSNRDTFWADVD